MPPARPCPHRSWAPRVAVDSDRHCPCCSQHAVRPSTPRPTPSDRCSASSSPHPSRSGERFRGQKLPAMIRTAASMRLNSVWDVETTTTVKVLRSLARRARALAEQKHPTHEKAIRAIVRSWRPDLLAQPGIGPSWLPRCCAPGPTTAGSTPRQRSPCSPAPHRSRPQRPGDQPPRLTATATANSTAPCTPSCSHESATTRPPRTYVARRTTQGKTTREIKRCLKRYIAETSAATRRPPNDDLNVAIMARSARRARRPRGRCLPSSLDGAASLRSSRLLARQSRQRRAPSA